MDPHTLDLLEFDKVRQFVAGYAASALGKAQARALAPLQSVEAISEALGRTTEMVEALAARLEPPLGGLRDVSDWVKRAALGVLLEPPALLDLRDLFDLTGRVHDYWLRLGSDYPRLEELLAHVHDQRHLARAIDAVIDAKGMVRDNASPELKDVRRQLAVFEERMQVELRRLVRDPQIKEALRYTAPTISGEHHVLAVAANHRHKVAGVVHRTSSTGETVYVEPAKVAEISAEMSLVKAAEQRAVRKVLRRLSDMVQRECRQLRKSLEVLAELDLAYAKARFSRDYSMTAPRFVTQGTLELVRARHPLLEHLFRQQSDGKSVVPISIHLGGPFDQLVITGPNTGGKTVVLKTVGLLTAMAHAGLHVPAEAGSQIPLLRDVLADIGDEQSLEQSLSTFSAHVSRIAQILKQSGKDTLVLLDELGAGTDPTEGAALGRAILDELVQLGARALVTTHLGDLKSYALSAPRVENAAVEFDAETLQPTYRLVIGQFGQSCALKIARRLELPRPLLQRAHQYLRRRRGRHDRQLETLQQLRQEAEQARHEAVAAQSRADQAAEELRKKADLLQQEAAVSAEITKARATLRPGDSVRVPRFDKSGTVQRVDVRRKRAFVTVGAVEWELALDELIPLPRSQE
jgi:DNA mismatch repair protein MutS2